MKMIVDIETYPNCFLLVAKCLDSFLGTVVYEISEYRDDSKELYSFLKMTSGSQMIGYNNLNFDGPIIQAFIDNPRIGYKKLSEMANKIIKQEGFVKWVYEKDRTHRWVDLFTIHGFNNPTKRTSLKQLEFVMKMDNVEDLPFDVRNLTKEECEVLIEYCKHDVEATYQFYLKSLTEIKFRQDLTDKYRKDVINYSDVKIGSFIFENHLMSSGVLLYSENREKIQTIRDNVDLKDCIPDYIETEEFSEVLNHFKNSTMNSFQPISKVFKGLEYEFGLGGLHASVKNKIFEQTEHYKILDVDCTSMYPSIAIENEYYPEHLGKGFVKAYKQLKDKRLEYAKGTIENAAYKLALNGVYGKSNDKFSVFYDMKFMLDITITGQLIMCMLAERVSKVCQIIQVNTDGLTVFIQDNLIDDFKKICEEWESITRMTLEEVRYSKMIIRDVNNYISVKTNGDVKRKGCFEINKEWHKDHSFLIVPKAAEKVLTKGVLIKDAIKEGDIYDYMGFVKCPKGARFEVDGKKVQSKQRYYVSKNGVELVKVLPPLAKNPEKERHTRVHVGRKLCLCNNVEKATEEIDYSFYIDEVEKLILGLC